MCERERTGKYTRGGEARRRTGIAVIEVEQKFCHDPSAARRLKDADARVGMTAEKMSESSEAEAFFLMA